MHIAKQAEQQKILMAPHIKMVTGEDGHDY